MDENFAPGGREVGSVDGTLYAVWFRAAQKSTVWYNAHVFDDAGVEPPTDWDELQDAAQTISDFGVTPYSIGVDVGWPLSDLFENIYIRTAGPDMYDQLATHEIPWTDPSVTDALEPHGRDLRRRRPDRGRDLGRAADRLHRAPSRRCSPTHPRARSSSRATSSAGVITGETQSKVGTDADFFDFPSIDDSPPAVVGGGDLAALLKDSEGGQALLQFLATPEAARGLGRARRLHLAEQGRATSRRTPTTIDRRAPRRWPTQGTPSATTCRTCSPPRSARRPARGSGGSCRTSWQTRATSTARAAVEDAGDARLRAVTGSDRTQTATRPR